MRILVSGMTALQVGSTKRQIQKIDVPASMVDMLKEIGHDVEWRRILCAETDFSKYDLLIACVAPITSSNSTYGLGVMKAMSKMKNVIIFYDDYKLNEIQNSFKQLLKRGEKQLLVKWTSGEPFYKDEEGDIVKSVEDILNSAEYMVSGNENWRILCPMFEWGNKELVKKYVTWMNSNNFNYIDPTPVVVSKDLKSEVEEKKKEWVIASLGDHTTWIEKQEFHWPVNYFGCRKLKSERLKTEEDVFKVYDKYYGILSPEYLISGSGWFRARFIYAAIANSILICGPRDGNELGEPYRIAPHEIELLYEEKELPFFARKQKDTIERYRTTIEQFKSKLSKIIL